MNFLIVIYILGYIVSWFLLQGWNLAYFQRNYPSIADKSYKSDKEHSIMYATYISLVWPIGIIYSFKDYEYFKYGWMPVWRKRNLNE